MSYQRQHELRELRQPSIYSRNDFRDDVDTVGLSLRLGSRRFTPVAGVGARLRGGGEVYFDLVRSNAFFHNLLVGTIRQLPRGLYADGARYYTGGVFAELDVDLFRTVRLRSAVRLGLAGARSEAEPMSATQRVHSDFAAPVGRVGLEWLLVPELSLIANVDQGFRAPNLDDLTSRQVIGPGFQLENASLRAERSTTFEVGARARGGGLALDAWLFATEIDDAITRAPRSLSECPRDAPECQGAFARFQLVNLDEPAWLLGGEVALRAAFPFGLGVTANVSYAWGEGPSPVPLAEGQRVPLSRVPPVHGTVEVRYANEETRLVVGAAMRWAGPQDRLSISDGSDARIPIGGTPAYAVFDLRAGWRFEDTVRLQLSVVFENVFDQVYRVHGSGINGAGRGLLVQLEGAL